MFINSDLHSVNEAYFGKSPRLVEIERNIKAIRSKFGTGNSLIGGAGLGGAVEQSAEWKKIRTLIEEQFGFYSVSLILLRNAQLNACTYPITWTWDGSVDANKFLIVTKNGMRYSKEAKFCTIICITEGLLFNKDFTEGEIVGVLLHEIGHNFDTTVYKHVGSFVFFSLVIDLMASIQFMDPVLFLSTITTSTGIRRDISTGINEIMETKLWAIYDTVNWILSIPFTIVDKLLAPILKMFTYGSAAVTGVWATIMTGGLSAFIMLGGRYSSENFADKFAGMHGYGYEQITALRKMETNSFGTESIIENIPLIGHAYGLYFIAAGMLAGFGEPHPVFSARVKSIIGVVSSDLKDKRIDKKTRDLIKKDLDNINKSLDEYAKQDVSYSKSVLRAYYEFLYKMYDKGDLRSTIMADVLDDDNVINKELQYKYNNPMRKMKVR